MIETGRLVLRNWTEADIEPFLRHTNTPQVMRWLGGVAEAGEAGARIRERIMAWQEERGFIFWVVERKADGALLGFCGLKIADSVGSPIEGMLEVGWRLREDAWGQGYAKEAAVASLDLAFGRLGASHVVALTVHQNAASQGLMKRLRMTRRKDMDFQSTDMPAELNPIIVYRIEAEEWRAARAAALS